MQINPSTLTLFQPDAATQKTASRLPEQTLGQDDFLKLVIAQMTNQDPLSPKSETQFVAQMAQFSALEQSKNMQQDVAQMRREQQLLQASALLDRRVSLTDDQGGVIQGTVTGIRIEEGTPKLMVQGQPYELSALLAVEPAS